MWVPIHPEDRSTFPPWAWANRPAAALSVPKTSRNRPSYCVHLQADLASFYIYLQSVYDGLRFMHLQKKYATKTIVIETNSLINQNGPNALAR
jgi:hypothetical protein